MRLFFCRGCRVTTSIRYGRWPAGVCPGRLACTLDVHEDAEKKEENEENETREEKEEKEKDDAEQEDDDTEER